METVLTTENRIAGRERGTVGWGEERKGEDDGERKIEKKFISVFPSSDAEIVQALLTECYNGTHTHRGAPLSPLTITLC